MTDSKNISYKIEQKKLFIRCLKKSKPLFSNGPAVIAVNKYNPEDENDISGSEVYDLCDFVSKAGVKAIPYRFKNCKNTNLFNLHSKLFPKKIPESTGFPSQHTVEIKVLNVTKVIHYYNKNMSVKPSVSNTSACLFAKKNSDDRMNAVLHQYEAEQLINNVMQIM